MRSVVSHAIETLHLGALDMSSNPPNETPTALAVLFISSCEQSHYSCSCAMAQVIFSAENGIHAHPYPPFWISR